MSKSQENDQMSTLTSLTTDYHRADWIPLPLSFWGSNRIASWLLHSDFASQYAAAFHKRNIDFERFKNVTDFELLNLGVTSKLNRVKLLRIAHNIRHVNPVPVKLGRKNSAPMWTKEHVCDWLDTLPFGWNYISRFEQIGIDGLKLVRLTDSSLRFLLKIENKTKRRRFLLAISALSKTGAWRHLPNLDYDTENGSEDPALGFFSHVSAISANFMALKSGLTPSLKGLAETFFPFHSRQVNMAMYTFKEPLSRKRKKNLMEPEDVAKWLSKLGYDPELVASFEQRGINGASLAELDSNKLETEFKVPKKTRTKLKCDIRELGKQLETLYTLEGCVKLYVLHYERKVSENLLEKREKERAQSFELKNQHRFLFRKLLSFSSDAGRKKAKLARASKRTQKEPQPEPKAAATPFPAPDRKEAPETKTRERLLRKRGFAQKPLLEWTPADTLDWAESDDVAKEYLLSLEGLNGEKVVALAPSRFLSAKDKKVRLTKAEARELMAAIKSLRAKYYRPRLSDAAAPARKPLKRHYAETLSASSFPQSLNSFMKRRKAGVQAAAQYPAALSAEKMPVYNANEFGFARAGLYGVERRSPLEAQIHASWKSGHGAAEALKRIAAVSLAQQREAADGRGAALESGAKRKTPPPPKDPRPPFDVGTWTESHVASYLKNISVLKTCLHLLEGLTGRDILDMDGPKIEVLRQKSPEGLKVLKGVSQALKFRDLENVAVETWTPTNVQAWFEIDTDLPQLGNLFRLKNITGKVLIQLTHEMLLSDLLINIKERERILVNIQKLIAKSKPSAALGLFAEKSNAHNSVPISQWSPYEVGSWLNSFSFGKLYADVFGKLQTAGAKLLAITNESLREDYLVPIAIHRDEMICSINCYRSSLKQPFADQPTPFTDHKGDSLYSMYGLSEASYYDFQTPFALEQRDFEPPRRKMAAGMGKLNGPSGAEKTTPDAKDSAEGNGAGVAAGGVSIECSFCKKKFDSTEILIEHLAVHEKICKHCGEIFATNESLENHVISTHLHRSGAKKRHAEEQGSLNSPAAQNPNVVENIFGEGLSNANGSDVVVTKNSLQLREESDASWGEVEGEFDAVEE